MKYIFLYKYDYLSQLAILYHIRFKLLKHLVIVIECDPFSPV